VKLARAHLKAGRHDSALAAFRRALERQPRHWALMLEIADFLTYTRKDHAAALEITAEALRHHPHCADLWNTRGDGLFYLERYDEAHAAFERALTLKPDDVRARFNLSYTLARRHERAAALGRIAEALALDEAGRYRDRLLEKQREILAEISDRHQGLDRCAGDRFRGAGDRSVPGHEALNA
jgi:protein O-GlcNAc transferase